MLTPEEYFKVVGHAISCGDCKEHPLPFNESDVIEVLHFEDIHDDIIESSDSFAVLKLKDGKFATFWESSDYSGHG